MEYTIENMKKLTKWIVECESREISGHSVIGILNEMMDLDFFNEIAELYERTEQINNESAIPSTSKSTAEV